MSMTVHPTAISGPSTLENAAVAREDRKGGEIVEEVDDSGLEIMTAAEASQMLTRRALGRLAFAYESWPVILPVNYIYVEPTVVIRTGPGAKLSAAPFKAVAFEVDDVDPLGNWGWSVLVQGPAFDITDADEERCRALRALPVRPSAPGVRDHWLTVTAVRISGRRFGPVPQ
jgi:uncharacterized protein